MISSKEDLQYLFNLIAIAMADGDISPHELIYLKKKASEKGISDMELQQLLDGADDIDFTVPLRRIERMSYIDDCIEMTMIDGYIHPKELLLCKRICDTLNLSHNYLFEAMSVKNVNVLKN